MHNLTLEHLTPYLPYGLKVQLTNDQSEDFDELIDMIADKDAFRKGAIWDIIGFADGNFSIPMGEGEIDGFILGRNYTYCSLHPREFKPILRHLSDLTKEIEHNGERFVPIDRISEMYGIDIMVDGQKRLIAPITLEPYNVIRQLFEWHIDVFGLIAAGIAVDMNTLEGGSSNGN